MAVAINIPLDQIRELCKRNHVARLALFGSALREDFNEQSDVDLLVEFLPGQTPGLQFFALQEEFSELLGREVDLNTPEDLSRFFREAVRRSARTLYATG